ncbi:DUF5131 family protein [Streptomyces caeni]|uniref:DUF5131 family protein n=1 Tax=Streptomyces caeni TaxID=2307231 RepID=A0ABW4IHZ2_9ACTN
MTTKIEWTNRTWNPVTGCTKVSPGCDNCYAETFAERWRGTAGHAYENGFDVQLRPERLIRPVKWRKPLRIFVNSMSDLFLDAVPDDFIAQAFAVMAATPQHTYQVLTKRHGRMRSLLRSDDFRRRAKEYYAGLKLKGLIPDRPLVINVWPLPNVWLGVSVENQQWANIRIPALLETPAAVRFLSCEPLLGPVDLSRWLRPVPDCGHVTPEDGTCRHPDAFTPECHRWADCPARRRPEDWHGLDWVIVGGESGPRARPMHPDWARQIRDGCDVVGVPFFFKQHGEWAPLGPLYGDLEETDEGHMEAVGLEVVEGKRVIQLESDGYIAEGHQPGDSRTWLMARVGKRRAGRELDGRTHDTFPRDDFRESIASGLTEDLDAFSRCLDAATNDTTRRTS